MDKDCTIRKRDPNSSPSWSQEDTEDESSSISYLVSSKKGEITKKLFFAINKQSLSSLLTTSFMKPQVLKQMRVLDAAFEVERLAHNRRICNTKSTPSGTSKDPISRALFKVKNIVNTFELTYSKLVSEKELTFLKKVNSSLLNMISCYCKENIDFIYIVAEHSSEDIALALLTMSSKKCKINKNTFVELARIFSNKQKDTLLKKGKFYYIIVWLLEGRIKSLTEMLSEVNLA